ncbi:MAG: PAS domain S-box protein [Scytolyngbya sp. HA4215-MV1]|jgi:PAS domain S-box-containing protein|nr:PAS domain S-box protein [Scytolyngbya sp. HA4215-MV1]
MFIDTAVLTQSELNTAIIRDPLIVSPDATVRDAIAQMSGVHTLCSASWATEHPPEELYLEARSSCVLVVENHQLLGILTERDVVKLSAQQRSLHDLPIRAVMTHPVITLRETAFTDLFLAINLLQQYHIRHLPILDEHDLIIGILTHESLRQTSRPVDLLRLRLVHEVMISDVICVNPDDSMLTIAQLMAAHRVSSVVVVQTQAAESAQLTPSQSEQPQERSVPARLQYPIGMITERDVVQFQALALDLVTCPVQAVMSTPIFAVNPNDSLWKVQQIMEQRFIRRLAVTGAQNELLGIITQSSLLQALNPLEIYKLAEVLEQKVLRLEAEKVKLLEDRTLELEQQVAERTVALQTREQEYATLAAASPVGIFRTDVDGNSTYANQRCCEMLGMTLEETYGIGWQKALHPDDRAQILAEQARARQENRPFQGEYRLLQPNGAVLWVLGQAVAEYSAEGQPIGYVGTVTDISDRKRIESERKSAETALQNLIAGTAAVTGQDFFPALVRHLALALHVRYALLAELQSGELSTRAFWADNQLQAKFVYDLENTPCKLVLERGIYCHSVQIRQAFPNNRNLVMLEVESYLGIALKDPGGQAIGLLAIMHSQPLSDLPRLQAILQIFAARAAAELQREQATQALEQLNQTLEARIEERTAALQQSEERWQLALEGSNDGIWDWELKANRVFYSSRWKQMRGYADTEISNALEEWSTRIHPEDYDRVTTELDAHLAGTSNFFEMEYRSRCKDGTYLWVSDRGKAFRDESGQVVRMSGSETNITERKRIEEALRRSEHRYASLAAAAPVAIFRFDNEFNCTYVNDRWSEMTGRPISAAFGRGWIETLHPDDRATLVKQWLERYVQSTERSQPFNVSEGRHLRPDGSINWFYVQIVQEVDADDNVIGYVGTLTDITDLKRLEQEQQRLIAILEASTDYISISDTTGQILWNNAAFKRLYNLTELADLSQRTIADYHPQWATELIWEQGIPTAIARGSWMGETALLTAEGQEIPVSQLILTHKSSQGEIQYISSIMRDMRVRKEYEQRLEQSNAELARATRLKDEFLANMSHELRTPLNAILGMSEGMQEQVFGAITDKQRQALQTIERSGEHLLELINDILDLAKIEAGQVELNCTPTSLSPLCQGSLAFVAQQAHQKQIQIEAKIQPNLPNLLIDERRIRQALINLLSNAVKFTSPGGKITLEVTLQTSTTVMSSTYPYSVRFAVIDTGIGISPEDLNNLFQPFIQIDSALNRQYEGTGLGLSLVKRLIELHGGYVAVSSEVGVGSCFSFDLPWNGQETEQLPAQLHSFGLDSTTLLNTLANRSPLILLVEDNEANISTMADYLTAKGYRVQVARNGQAAIDLITTASPDLVVMDIQMPGMDGLEAIQQIRRQPHLMDLPIIAVTALAMTGDRDRCMNAGVSDYLSKPVKLKQLVTMIQQYLIKRST